MNIAEALALAPRPRAKRRHDEDRLQEQVVTWLRLVLDPNLYRVAAVPNGGSRNALEAARMKRTGTLAGVFDVFILGPGGVTYWLELKAKHGRLSSAQNDMLMFKVKNGVPYVVARQLSDVEAAVAQWKLLQTRVWA